jgi:hypothetical protein
MTTSRKSRRNDEMKFAYAGPFVTLLDPIKVLPPSDERYAATSPENYTIGSRIDETIAQALVDRFGSEALRVRSKRARRGKRGGRKQVAS